jgi:16S rRNA (guanine527-N7)-methyltransferase
VTEPLNALAQGAAAILGRELTGFERANFAKYLNLLIKWRRSHRLVGSADPHWIVENLFLDSLLFLRVLPPALSSLLDLGSGAGVPGIPIKIVRTGLTLVLVESRRRRASFLSAVVRELGLENTRVIGGRAEEFTHELAGRFDAVVMRCAGDVEALLPTAARLVVPSGMVVASGPPAPRPTKAGEWISVEGYKPGSTRRFLIHRPA